MSHIFGLSHDIQDYNPFASDYITTVDTSVQRFIPDLFLPNSILTGSLTALIKDYDFVKNNNK